MRGLACAQARQELPLQGFTPDVVLAEFFYATDGADFNFDPEFQGLRLAERARLRLKNSVHLQALQAADSVYTTTEWRRRRWPRCWRWPPARRPRRAALVRAQGAPAPRLESRPTSASPHVEPESLSFVARGATGRRVS